MLGLAIAAATSVLTGALIVGDSMRSSLRNLALDRLGEIDEILVADGFFRKELGQELSDSPVFDEHYQTAETAILLPNGSVTVGDEFGDSGSDGLRRANGVTVLGIESSFWALGDPSLDARPVSGRQVIINQALAQQLRIGPEQDGESLTLRIPKPGQLPSDSALGKKNELIESLVELEVTQILPNQSLARFGLRPSQIDSPNIFLSYKLLADSLAQSGLDYKSGPQANAIFLSGRDSLPPSEQISDRLFASFSPALEDLGIRVKTVRQSLKDDEQAVFEYYSISSDRLVLPEQVTEVAMAEFPDAKPVLSYLANQIKVPGQPSGIPFSTVAAIDFDDEFPLLNLEEERISNPGNGEIVLNEWAARDLNVAVGDSVELSYFEPETTHGDEVERKIPFRVAAIAKLTQPDTAFVTKGKQVIPAVFQKQLPTRANDPDLVPEVPGLTDAQSIEDWKLPFPTEGIREVDDDYWNYYRTTPKAFVSLQQGQRLWSSRFGKVTSLQVPGAAGQAEDILARLQKRITSSNTKSGFSIVPIKRLAIKSSSGATPFDVLFLALSMFVIAAALLLVSLLLRLALNRRASEMGTFLATGFDQASLSQTLQIELNRVVILGTLLGLVLGVAYAALMIFGLRTWWLGAIAAPILELRVSPVILIIGAILSCLICYLTIRFTVRSTRNQSVRNLLAGEWTSKTYSAKRSRWWYQIAVAALVILAVGLSIFASTLGGEPQAGAFMGAGFLLLTALLFAIRMLLGSENEGANANSLSLNRLAMISGKRNPLRSTLTIALVAVASFLIIAVSSFRLSPSEAGTGGFNLIASSDQPIFETLDEVRDLELDSFSMRVKSGDDASCTNLYQSSQPQVIGVTQRFIDSFDGSENQFRWSATTAEDGELDNPWKMLNRIEDDGAIPVVIDKNTANYSLKIFAVGGDYQVDFDTGEKITFRVVGFLENSILQGSLIVSEEQFVQAFPLVPGYRQFLIRNEDESISSQQVASKLESRFGDQGFDAELATEKLARYQRVQNTYISTFQTLGGLGLLLGTFGLAAVQIRSVFERQRELGLMRSVGFSRPQLSKMILLENIWLLMTGLAIGIIAAMVTTVPHYFVGGASIPWLDLAALLLIIVLFGVAAAWLASRIISKLPLIASLRAG